jgi:hypothetical protein
MSTPAKRSSIRIFRDDETTELWYHDCTHIFWTNNGTILTICLPDKQQHVHWPREQISHYDIFAADAAN